MSKKRGLFVGLATVDIQYLMDTIPVRDGKTAARDLAIATGGPATNAAVTFSHLGGQSRLVTRVGEHPFTAFMQDDLHRYGVDLMDLAPALSALPTLSSVVSVPGSGHRSIVTFRPEDAIAVEDRVLSAALDEIDIVLVDGFHLDVAVSIATMARDRGIPVVLDGGSWQDGMANLLPSVDVAICAENFRPPGTDTPAAVFDYLAGHGVKLNAITAGGKAILYSHGGSCDELPVENVHAVDTSGAGDILHGAFCYYYAGDAHFVMALEHAARVATRSCQSFGTRVWMHRNEPHS